MLRWHAERPAPEELCLKTLCRGGNPQRPRALRRPELPPSFFPFSPPPLNTQEQRVSSSWECSHCFPWGVTHSWCWDRETPCWLSRWSFHPSPPLQPSAPPCSWTVFQQPAASFQSEVYLQVNRTISLHVFLLLSVQLVQNCGLNPTCRCSFWQLLLQGSRSTRQRFSFSCCQCLGRSFFGINSVLTLELELFQKWNFMEFLKQQAEVFQAFSKVFEVLGFNEYPNTWIFSICSWKFENEYLRHPRSLTRDLYKYKNII